MHSVSPLFDIVVLVPASSLPFGQATGWPPAVSFSALMIHDWPPSLILSHRSSWYPALLPS